MGLTIKAAQNAHPLAKSVLRQLGGGTEAIDSAKDAARHGAGGGFPGFTYYTDTCRFTHRNRRAIADVVAEQARELGESGPIASLRMFACLKDWADDPDFERQASLALYGGGRGENDLRTMIENALAWYALEEVGHALLNTED